MPALFVLMPESRDLDQLLAGAPAELQAARAAVRCRLYPRATDGRHLLSLVRAGRDPVATRWLRGTALAVAAALDGEMRVRDLRGVVTALGARPSPAIGPEPAPAPLR